MSLPQTSWFTGTWRLLTLFWPSHRSQVIWTTARATWRPSMTLTTTSFSPNSKGFWSQTTSGSTRYQAWSKCQIKPHPCFKRRAPDERWRPQVNLNKPCPFWPTSSHCGLRDCAVKPCSPVSFSSPLSNALFFAWPIRTNICSQNEVPEGVRVSHHDKVSLAGWRRFCKPANNQS